MDVKASGQPGHFLLTEFSSTNVPQLEISVCQTSSSFLRIDRDVIVTVRSVHLMERAHSVENLVLNPPNNLLLSAGGETGVAEGDGLGSSQFADIAPAIVSPTSLLGIFLGKAEQEI